VGNLGKVIGIDLGTTNSCIAYLREGGEVEIISNSNGARITPSVVAFSESGEILVGESAKNQIVLNSERTISSIKREMGNNSKVKIGSNEYTPQEISALILKKLKNDAEEYFGEPVEEAVITVPAYFSDAQRQATKDAGRIAGLKVKRIINEPTAAALAYGEDKRDDHTILVYDLGGGTFDVSILEITYIDGEKTIEVKSTNGINRLGGDDFDKRLTDYIAESFKKESKIDLSKDRMAYQSIKNAAEKCKIELSDAKKSRITIPFISANEKGPIHLDMEITRAKFESLIEDLIDSTLEPVKKALEDAVLKESDIDRVILVGGSTRIPMVQDMLRNIFKSEIYKGINPDEAVARGAAIQAGVISDEIKGIVLVDVTPLTLGVETEGGMVTAIIERNSVVPVTESKMFTTVTDNQDSVEIHIVQGERSFARDNISLGKFELKNIRKAPKGEPRIEVKFDIDVNGILNVSAVDTFTGSSQKIVISNGYTLSESEINRMVMESEKFGTADKKAKKEMELKNDSERALLRIKRAMIRYKEKVSEEFKKEADISINDIENLLESEIEFESERAVKLIEDLDKKSEYLEINLKND
jgi:molecular chaperone DnaK